MKDFWNVWKSLLVLSKYIEIVPIALYLQVSQIYNWNILLNEGEVYLLSIHIKSFLVLFEIDENCILTYRYKLHEVSFLLRTEIHTGIFLKLNCSKGLLSSRKWTLI